MSFEEILQKHPYFFWAFIYFAWGAAYSALISSGIVVATVIKKIKMNGAMSTQSWLVPAQIVWALVHLTAVFAFPILVGIVSRDTLTKGTYAPFLVVGFVVGLASLYLVARSFWKFSDMFHGE